MVEQRQIPASRVAMAGAPRLAQPAAALTPKEIMGILRRRMLLIISLTVLGFFVGGTAWFLLRRFAPKYTARTYIKVLPPIIKDPLIITSQVVNKDIQYGYRVSMVALLKQQSTLQSLLERDKVKNTKWFRSFGEVRDTSIVKAIDDLNKRFRAVAVRDGDYIVVTMTCGDRRESALIVNEIVDLFVASQGTTTRKEVSEKLARLNDQLDRIEGSLASSERALDETRRSYDLTDIEQEAGRNFRHTIELTLDDLVLKRNDLVLEINQLQAAIKNLEELAVGPINEQIENQIERDPVMLSLAQQLAFQESELAGRLTKFGENHRSVRQIQDLIKEIRLRREIRKAEIAEQTRQANLKNAEDSLIVMQERYAELGRQQQESEAKKKNLDLARVEYERRQSIRDERKERLDELKRQIEKQKIILEDPETPKVQRVGYAPPPLRVSFPSWSIFFPGGTMLGLLAGVGLAFLVELLSDLVRTPRDVSKYLHVPLLGIIPDAAEDEQVENIDLCHVVRDAPYSLISESYRRFRTNLKLSGPAESLKTLLVTSGMAGDGKTSVAVNLAVTFVAEDKKILLIDANFWRPSLHRVFPNSNENAENKSQEGRPSEFGLSTALLGRCGYQEVIRPSGIEGFDIIDSGLLPSNPTELISGARMKQLLKHQRENYDYVIVDGPPVLLVSDVKALATFVDGNIVVFNAEATRRGAARRIIRELREVNAKITGCVLFSVKAMKGGYFEEQFKSYREYQETQLAHSV
ncbi:MAG: polysaccharide biosynthesis tyrosine autokinase [Planctomycetota bacterium]|jgi:capsular exopolysaccharide synthesis family protein